MRRISDHESPYWYEDQVSLMSDMDSPPQPSQLSNNNNVFNYSSYNCKKELINNHHFQNIPFQIPHQNHTHLLHLPLFENPKMLLPPSTHNINNGAIVPYDLHMNPQSNGPEMQQIDNNHSNATKVLEKGNNSDLDVLDQVTDWRVLDKFVASQLSQDDVAKAINNSNNTNNYSSSGIFPSASISDQSNKESSLPDKASTPTSTSQIDVWK